MKFAILGGEPKATIAACEIGEDAACFSYRAAPESHNLLSETRSMVEVRWRAIDKSREWLREIHKDLEPSVPLPEQEIR